MQVFQTGIKYPVKLSDENYEVVVEKTNASKRYLLKTKLMEIFRQLYPRLNITLKLRIFTSCNDAIIDAMSWKCLLYSLITNDDDKNKAMLEYATKVYEILSGEVWNQDMWVLLCEKVSDILNDDSIYQNVIQIALLNALNEKNCRDDRIKDVMSLFGNNPFFILCVNVISLLTDPYQKCYFILLCMALSGQQKVYIYNYYEEYPRGAPHNEVDSNISLSLLTMSQKRWTNIFQVTNLLKRKRELLRMLSIEDVSTSFITDKEAEEQKPDTAVIDQDKNKQSADACPSIKIEINTNKQLMGINAEHIKIKHKLYNTEPVKVEDHKIKIEQKIGIDTPSIVENIYDEQGVNTNACGEVEEKPDTLIGVEASVQLKEIKWELNPEVTEPVVTNQVGSVIDQKTYVKKENAQEEATGHGIVPLLTEIKIKKVQRYGDATVTNLEDKQIQNEKNTEEKLSLDQLILNISYQQLNRRNSVICVNDDCINISDSDDDVCILDKDRKIEIPELVNMYHKIVLDEPTKMVTNPLSDKHDDQHFKWKTLLKKPKGLDGTTLQDPHYSTLLERNSSVLSTSSKATSSKSSRKSTEMSIQKLHNKIRRNRSKTNVTVKKLFDHLRNESKLSAANTENSVVVLDDTITPVALDDTVVPETTPNKLDETVKLKKRKSSGTDNRISKKRRYFSKPICDVSTPVVAIDVEGTSSGTPKKSSTLLCSTPNPKVTDLEFIPLKTRILNPNNNISAAKNLNEEITDLTKEINSDSYLTIDLTTESLNCSAISKTQNTVIDLDRTVDNHDHDCTVVSIENDNLSISGESDVTVLNMPKANKDRQLQKFVKGISKLDAAEKGKLLELITQNIFSGCSVKLDKKKNSLHDNEPREKSTRATETAEDTYIKEVILGQSSSRNSIGSNIYNPERDGRSKTGLRMVVIDGSNVAMQHGRGQVFSVKGLKICIDYFLKRGHVVKAFVPRFRCKFGKSTDPRLLDHLEQRGLVVYTPSREIQGRLITSYDDRYIVQCAAEFDGVIVSGDNYRDLLTENPRWRAVIENRLLMFTWVEDMIMFPKDPLGRNGPSLEQFLRHPDPKDMESQKQSKESLRQPQRFFR